MLNSLLSPSTSPSLSAAPAGSSPASFPAPYPMSFDDAVVALRGRVAGDVFVPGDADYDTARAGWNLLLHHQPAVVVVAATAGDVAVAVRFARTHDLGVAVQATGHGPGRAIEGGLLIVTARLTGVTIQPELRRAIVECGAKWGAVLPPAQEHGLAPLLGSTTDVGAVGYTLGGGMGWLARNYGLASDSVIAFDLVTPDGIEVRVSADEQPELFWALCGGGAGMLGVVTSMEIDLYPVTTVYAGNLFYPIEQAREVLTRWHYWVASAPRALTSAVGVIHFPPIDDVPEPMRGRSFVYVRGCWCGDLAEGETLIDGWRAWSEPAIDLFGAMPFSMADTISNDPVDPMPAMLSTEWLNRIEDAAISALLDAVATRGDQPPTLMGFEIRHAGGAIRDQGVDAVNHRSRRDEFLVSFLGLVMAPELAPVVSGGIAAARAALAPYASGATYLNFTDGAERADRSSTAFTPEHGARLAAVKRALDATNRFRHGFVVDSH